MLESRSKFACLNIDDDSDEEFTTASRSKKGGPQGCVLFRQVIPILALEEAFKSLSSLALSVISRTSLVPVVRE